jgi:excisionase family DNA binding protein
MERKTRSAGQKEETMSRIETTTDIGLERSPTDRFGRKPLTDVEVASRLGVSRFTVRAWRLKGHGPKFLKMGRAVRYRPEDVDEYERQALVETQAESRHAGI